LHDLEAQGGIDYGCLDIAGDQVGDQPTAAERYRIKAYILLVNGPLSEEVGETARRRDADVGTLQLRSILDVAVFRHNQVPTEVRVRPLCHHLGVYTAFAAGRDDGRLD